MPASGGFGCGKCAGLLLGAVVVLLGVHVCLWIGQGGVDTIRRTR